MCLCVNRSHHRTVNGHTKSNTKKERRKIEIKNSLEPIMTDFFLCKDCKNKYIENNICKGRHLDKIGKNETNF